MRRRCRATESRTKRQATSPLSGQSGAGPGSGQGLQSSEPGKATGLRSGVPARRTRNSGRPRIRPTTRRTGKSDGPTWRLIGPPAVPPGSSPDERRLPFPPAAATARLHRAGPDLRPLAGLDRHRTTTARPLRRHAKKAAVRLWHRARDFDRGTHQPGHHGGAVGHTGLAVLHALIFDFLNHRTGRLDPSYAAIAAKAGVCVRTVATRAAAAEGARAS